jgi:NAD(P)-dependent dehydrogenase (short-subunit alcohol dehydrogenase family)
MLPVGWLYVNVLPDWAKHYRGLISLESGAEVNMIAQTDSSQSSLRKTALVTGASRGFGAALSRSLARAGWRVVLVARSRERLESVAREIRDSGGEAWAIVGDIAEKRAIHRMSGEAAALVGSIDLVVHNAATLGAIPLRSLAETDCEQLELALATNLLGPFRLSKALVGSMVIRRRGLLVHVSSDAAREAYAEWGAYGISKAALEHLSRTWDTELAGTGVRSMVFDPGEMNTQMHAEALPDADPSTLLDPNIAAERLVAMIRNAWPNESEAS